MTEIAILASGSPSGKTQELRRHLPNVRPGLSFSDPSSSPSLVLSFNTSSLAVTHPSFARLQSSPAVSSRGTSIVGLYSHLQKVGFDDLSN